MLGVGVRPSNVGVFASASRIPAVAAISYTLTPMGREALAATPTISPTNATAVTNLTNMAANRADAQIALTANTTHTVGLSLPASSAGGRVLYLSTSIQGSTAAPTLTLTSSTDGGTTQVALALLDGPSIDRGVFYTLPDAACTLTLAFANKASGQTLALGVRVLPTDTTKALDIHSLFGTSYEEYGFQPQNYTASIKAAFPASDPCVLQIGTAGSTSSQVKAQCVAAANANSFALRRGVSTISIGGNDFQSLRPYSANSANATITAIPSNQQGAVAAVRSKSLVPPILIGCSFRDYSASPLVNDNANPENGSLPFNLALTYPDMATTLPEWFDSDLKVPMVDEYACFLANRHRFFYGSADGIHISPAENWGIVRDFRIRAMGWRFYGGTRPTSYYELAVAALEGTPTQDNLNAAQELVTSLPASAAKTAFQSRINAVTVPADTYKSFVLNFTDTGYTVTLWGVTNVEAVKFRNGTVTSVPVLDQNNKATGWTVEYAPPGTRQGTSGVVPGTFPDAIQSTYCYTDSGSVSTETSLGFRLRGPAGKTVPLLEVMSSRQGTGTDNVQWTVNGANPQIVNARGNATTLAAFSNTALNASNYVDVVGTPSGTGKTFVWLNAARGRVSL